MASPVKTGEDRTLEMERVSAFLQGTTKEGLGRPPVSSSSGPKVSKKARASSHLKSLPLLLYIGTYCRTFFNEGAL